MDPIDTLGMLLLTVLRTFRGNGELGQLFANWWQSKEIAFAPSVMNILCARR
jgi:hypothetical protein